MSSDFADATASCGECLSLSARKVYRNLTIPALVESAVRRGEGRLGIGGSLHVTTGRCTGRSPRDKFIVREPATVDGVCWQNNAAMDPSAFAALHADMRDHIRERECFVQDLHCSADPRFRASVRVITTFAWHSLFIRHLLRRPKAGTLARFIPDFTVVNCPDFSADPERHGCRSNVVIAMSFDRKLILIAGTEYGGEIKKAVFTYVNYLLPDQGVVPMHCAANHAKGNPEDVAIFFGLSGTGKTTLSADPSRTLIGDDEHGWSNQGTFNLEGGCYAKTLNLDAATEPEIEAATRRFGSVIENAVVNPENRQPDFSDDSLTANGRCAYPLEAIPNASETGQAGQPRHIVMLTCDAFGVLPPIARLSSDQAVYHFLSGFTAKIPGTERGVREPQPTFSACFGSPFMPRRPEDYGRLLRERITESGCRCWLVNTGWTGGGYGAGSRLPLATTRRLLSLALDGRLEAGRFRPDRRFGFDVPISAPGVDDRLLRPRDCWPDPGAFDRTADRLLGMFSDNYARFGAGNGLPGQPMGTGRA